MDDVIWKHKFGAKLRLSNHTHMEGTLIGQDYKHVDCFTTVHKDIQGNVYAEGFEARY